MKIIAILVCVVCSNQIIGQWQTLDIPTANTLTAVHFKNDEVGFVCGGKGIFKTSNGGADWSLCYQGASLYQFEDIKVISSNTVVAVGYDFDTGQSLMLRSVNSGVTWTKVALASSSNLKAVFFVDQQLGYCAGSGGTILKSTNGGESWIAQNSGVSGMIQSIFFVDGLTGFAVGGGPGQAKMFRTNNGGEDWEEISLSDSTDFLQSVFFIDQSTGYTVGWNGTIQKTLDGGDSWFPQMAVNMQGNMEVFFTDPNTGYIAGGNFNVASIQKTDNAGDEWKEIGPNLPYGLIGIHFPSDEVGYAVGANGTIVKTTTGGISLSYEINQPSWIQSYPNPVVSNLIVKANGSGVRSILLYDCTGFLVKKEDIAATEFEIDISNMPAGNYYVIFEGANEKVVRKLTKI